MLELRALLSTVAFTFFGYVSPVLNSIKAVVSKDQDGIKEYVTYWVVLSSLMYIEALLSLLNWSAKHRQYAPELKVLFVLWLTLPRFQGAYRIYTVLLQPYFEKYEDEIDRKVEEIAGEVRKKASRQLRTILWQLFLAPNDGLIAGGIGSIGVVLSMLESSSSGSGSSLQLCETATNEIVFAESGSAPPPTRTPPRGGLLTLQKQMLTEFVKLLTGEGICVVAGRSSDSKFLPYQFTLDTRGEGCEGAERHLCFHPVAESPDDDDEVQIVKQLQGFSVPLSSVVAAELCLIQNEDAVEGMPAVRIALADVSVVYLREEEIEGGETEALHAGMGLLISDCKSARARPGPVPIQGSPTPVKQKTVVKVSTTMKLDE